MEQYRLSMRHLQEEDLQRSLGREGSCEAAQSGGDHSGEVLGKKRGAK